jgi:anti-sigma-K factor RskA
VGRIILVVQPSNDATLVLNGLGQADSEWAYQIWVTPPDSITPRSAGLFSGRELVVPLTSPVPPGAVVAVTLEPATGSFAPTRRLKLVVERPA